MLKGKKIVLGITGGIAAYKTTFLIRSLVKEGAEVKVILTKAACEFVSPNTLSVLSKNKVYIEFFDANLNWNNHVELANWADLILIAPLTANTIAKMATGICDNLLLATYFSAVCPVFLVPAMDLEMYKHPVLKKNLESLGAIGHIIIPAEHGELASGLVGEGRMSEPETIINKLIEFFQETQNPINKSVLINAGPTYEPIDQVRFIGNRSSGKMGIELAECFAAKGFKVTLVLGPSMQNIRNFKIDVIRVETADEMFQAMLSHFENQDIVICSAAVSDFKPKYRIPGKIKKSEVNPFIELEKNKDILFELGLRKKSQFLAGFALETENLIPNAEEKLKKKNLDLIIANLTNSTNSAFYSDNNNVILIGKDNKKVESGLKPKKEIAQIIFNHILDQTSKNN